MVELSSNQIIEYINNDGKCVEKLIELFQYFDIPNELIDEISNDTYKTKILLFNGRYSNDVLHKINNNYYKGLLTERISNYNFDGYDLVQKVNEYEMCLQHILSLETEDEKTQYICSLKDNDMIVDFLTQIKGKENRIKVIDSLKKEIDPRIQSIVELSKGMIKEYFEDTLGNKFDEKKREKMEIVFNRSNVSFQNLQFTANGVANYVFQSLKISTRHIHNMSRTIGFLIHEYEHLFSNFDFKLTNEKFSTSIEEGMADLFSDKVINHYLDKHKEIILDGRKLHTNIPYETYSSYDFESAYPRTMMIGLKSSNKDDEAIAEYVLGDKVKFSEIVFGKENTANRAKSLSGIPDLDTSIKELAELDTLDFSNIDSNSIYARRNFIVPLFELQNRFDKKGKEIDLVGILAQGKCYYANFVGDKYFDGKKLYDIPREELKEFMQLLKGQIEQSNGNTSIININDFQNKMINELSEEEIAENSFEILDSTLALFIDLTKAGRNLERIIELATVKEIEKVQKGQSLEETLKKYVRIIPDYLKLVDPKRCDSNMYICDYIEDLKYSYIEQILQGNQDEINKWFNERGIKPDDELTDILSGQEIIDVQSLGIQTLDMQKEIQYLDQTSEKEILHERELKTKEGKEYD